MVDLVCFDAQFRQFLVLVFRLFSANLDWFWRHFILEKIYDKEQIDNP